MSEHTRQIFCVKCDTPLRGPANAAPTDKFECPSCGVTETVAKVIEEIKNHEGAQKKAKTSIAMADIKAGKPIKVPAGPTKTYRFKWRDVRGPLN
jgi:DNA-directed RNA polymerase subunit M/transcription elongation factor TFIIS